MKVVLNPFTGRLQLTGVPEIGDLVFKGSFDASAGQLPQNANSGNFWKVSVAGIIGSLRMEVGESLYAIQDTGATPTENMFVVIANATADNVPVIGTPTYNSVQDMHKVFNSAGILEGGEFTDNGDGTIDVAAGKGLIRSSDSDIAPLYSFEWGAFTNQALTDNAVNYISIDYNAGSPTINISTLQPSDFNSRFCLGIITREGTNLHINQARKCLVANHGSLTLRRFRETDPFARVDGAMLSETGTRNLVVTAGTFWEGLVRFTTAAIDTSAADTFDAYYRDGAGGWNEQTGQTQYSNTLYDNNSGTLAAIGVAKYGVHWVFLGTDGDLMLVYGRGSYSLVEAQDAQVPADLPPQVTSHGRLIGKIIILQAAASAISIQSAFNITFEGAPIVSHNDTSGLQGGAASQYYHLSLANYTNILGGITPLITALATNEAYAGEITTEIVKENATGFGALLYLQDGAKLVLSGTYQWTASGSGTNEYYLELAGGGDPAITEPDALYLNKVLGVIGAAGSLAAGEWDWADNDTLGFSTVYVRLSDGTDPDTKADGYILSKYNYKESDASALATMPAVALALVSGTGSKTLLRKGFVRNDSWNFIPNKTLYASETGGAITQTAPTTSGAQVQILGKAITPTIIEFNPNSTLIELT